MRITKITLLALLLTLGVPSLAAEARGRYHRGQVLVQHYCSPCLAMGWEWAPQTLDPARPHNLKAYARDWSPAKVCTWMRQPRRKLEGPGCYPGHVSRRDRLDMLYYLHRRAQGPITRPLLQRPTSFKRYQGKALKRTLESRRKTAMQQHRARLELEKMRQKSRAASRGQPAPATRRHQGGR